MATILKKLISRIKNFIRKFINRCFHSKYLQNQKLERGRIGESLAVNFLKKRNFRIVARNWRFGKGEIDIIGIDKNHNMLVFIEVKSRQDNAFVPGYFSVDNKKKTILQKTCMSYLRQYAKPTALYRFDIVEIRFHEDLYPPKIFHFENVKMF